MISRRKFFKRLTVGITAVIVSPQIIAEVTRPEELYYPMMKDWSYEKFRTLFVAGTDTVDQDYRYMVILKSRRSGSTYMYRSIEDMNYHRKVLDIQNKLKLKIYETNSRKDCSLFPDRG